MIQELSVLALLGICSVEDVRKRQIRICWPILFAVEGIIWQLTPWRQSGLVFYTGWIPGMCVLLLAFAAKGSIGEGDGILLMVTGIFLGASDTIRIFLYAVFMSAGYALFLYVLKKKSKYYEMPFVPFLLAAFVGALFVEKGIP